MLRQPSSQSVAFLNPGVGSGVSSGRFAGCGEREHARDDPRAWGLLMSPTAMLGVSIPLPLNCERSTPKRGESCFVLGLEAGELRWLP